MVCDRSARCRCQLVVCFFVIVFSIAEAWIQYNNKDDWLAAIEGTVHQIDFGTTTGRVTDPLQHQDQGLHWSLSGDGGNGGRVISGMSGLKYPYVFSSTRIGDGFTSPWRMDFVDPDTGVPRPVTAAAVESPSAGIRIRIKDVSDSYISPYWNGGTGSVFMGLVAEPGEEFYTLIVGSSAAHGSKTGPISYAVLAEATSTATTTTASTTLPGPTTTTLTPAPGSDSASGPPVLIFGGRTFTGSPTDFENLVGHCTCPLGGGLSIAFTAKWESLGSSGGYTTIIDFGNGGSSNKIFIAGVGGSTSLLIAVHYVGSWHNLTIPSAVGVGGYNRYLFTLGSSGYVEVYKNGGLVGSAGFVDPLPYLSRSELYVAPGFSGYVGGLIVWNRVVGWSECEVIPFTLVVVGSHHVGAGSTSGATVEYYFTGSSTVEWTYGARSGVQLLWQTTCDGCRASQEVLLPGWPSSLTFAALGGDSWGYKEITLTGGGWDPEVPGGGGSSFTNETRTILNSTYGELEGRNAFWLCGCVCCHPTQVYYVPSTSNLSRPALILAGREFSGGPGDSENMTAYVDGPLGGNFSMAFSARWDAPGTAIQLGGTGKHQLVVVGGGSSSTSLLLGHQFVNSAGELAWSNLTVSNAITIGGSARFLWTISAGGLSSVYQNGGLVGSVQAVAGPSTTLRSSLLVGQGGDQYFQGMVSGLMVWRKVVGWGDGGIVWPYSLSVTTSTRSGAGSNTGARVQYSVGGQWTVPQHYVSSVSVGEIVSSGFQLTQWPAYVRLIAGGDDNWGYKEITLTQTLSQTGPQSKTVLTSADGQVFWNNKFWVSTSSPPGSDVAPMDQTYCVPGIGACSTSATGDPHITNILGQRFDLRRTGTHLMVQLPKGAPPNRTLLRVKASLFSEVPCGPTFIKSLVLTGTWAYQLQRGGIHFEARPGDVERHGWGSPARLNLGPVVVVVYLRHTSSGTPYLNLHVNLLKATDPVGGLFGEDDHRWATQPPECDHAHQARKGFLALSKSIQRDALSAKDGEGSVIRLAIKRHHHLELATNDAVDEEARDGSLDGWQSPTL